MKTYILTFKTITLTVLMLFTAECYSQSLGQDAEGFSSIVIPSFNIYLDGTNNIASLSIYREINPLDTKIKLNSEIELFNKYKWNINKIDSIRIDLRGNWIDDQSIFNQDKRNNRFLVGLDIKGTAENGVAPIFSDDKLASSASISGLVGFTWSRLKYNRKLLQETDTTYINGYVRDRLTTEKKNPEDKIAKKIKEEVKTLVRSGLIDKSSESIFNHLKGAKKKFDKSSIEMHLSSIESLEKDSFDVNENIKEHKAVLSKVDTIIARVKELDNYNALKKVIAADSVKIAKLQEVIAVDKKKLATEKDKDKRGELQKLLDENRAKKCKLEKIIADNRHKLDDSVSSLSGSGINDPDNKIEVRFYLDMAINKIQVEVDNVSIKSLRNRLSIPEKDVYKKATWDKFREDLNGSIETFEYGKFLKDRKKKTINFDTLKALYKQLNKEIISREKAEKKKKKKLLKSYFSTNYFYARGGFIGSKFVLDLNNGATTVEERFPEINFQSYTLELGYTRNFKNKNYFGANVGMSYNHNLAGLDEATFALQKIDTTITEGAFASSQEVKAFSGSYDRFLRYDFNLDFVRLVSLKETQRSNKKSHIFLSLNPYIRHRIYQNADILKNHMVAGFGAHAFNSEDNKLMGGVFIQTEDLFGVHKDDEDVLNKGVQFGLIVKYNFKGLKPEAKSK